MAYVSLPCEFEEWWDYKKILIMLSHLRSVQDLNLLISSHTRPEDGPSPTSRSLAALKGLVAFLSEFCTPDEQKRFVSSTLPFIARSAVKLEDRVPMSGIPTLEQQENSALVLGRKVILSILSNAFLCTFIGETATFSFEKFFSVFLGKNATKKATQAEKLRCILCYFERATSELFNLSAVITYRRQVLSKKELPQLVEWQNNFLPLCPFEVDDENYVEDSGGHTLQVCFASKHLGGCVLREGCGEEEIRFTICPELLLACLVMEDIEDNEVVIVTGAERFSSYSGFASTFKFAGEYIDESERDVFGNMLNSLIALNAGESALPSLNQQFQYQTGTLLRDLNKAYISFYCQQDRGDINTELLALTIKRGSLAFVAEDYPECSAYFDTASRQSDLGNMHVDGIQTSPGELRISIPQVVPESSSPLSPIPEITESPNFHNFLAGDIIKSGLKQVQESADTTKPAKGDYHSDEEEEVASRLVSSLFEDPHQLVGEEGGAVEPSPGGGRGVSHSMDNLAFALSASILKASVESGVKPPSQPFVVDGANKFELENKSNSLAQSIISNVLISPGVCRPLPAIVTPQTLGESSDSTLGGETLSSLATDLSFDILSSAIQNCSRIRSSDPTLERYVAHPQSSLSHPAIFIEVERSGSVDSGHSSHSSSHSSLHEYVNDLANEAIHEGISVAQITAEGQEVMGEEGPGPPVVVALADNLVFESIQNGLLECQRFQGDQINQQKLKQEQQLQSDLSPLPTKKQPSSLTRQGLCLSGHANSSGAQGQKVHDPPPRESSDHDIETPSGSNLNSRLLTPLSSRGTTYAWSIASTRDEDSRPVSPTDLNKIGLSLSNNTEEFSSLFSNIVINNAICNVTGETLSPHSISTEKQETEDYTNLPSSSKIGIFLSKLGEAEPPSDGAITPSSNPNTWQKMRRQLLRPIATGSCAKGGDPQMMAMIQWMAASASGRPRVFYYRHNEESVQELAQVTSHLRSRSSTVGQLCQSLTAFVKKTPKERKKCSLFSFLLQNS